jgi:site-specific DNA recombinase
MPPPRRTSTAPGRAGRAVLYVRVSATMGRGGEDFHSPELQLDAMRRHVKPVGLREVAVVQDIDVSGRSFSRDGIDKIRAMVEARQIDVVAVYDLSRLGRNTADSLKFIAWLRENGVGIISTVEQITDTPEGQLMLTQFLGWAQFQSDQTGRRWSEVVARRARDQGLGHGRTPIGYVKDGRGVVKHPETADAVADVIRRYGSGESILKLAERLATLRGRPILPTTVRRVCTSRFYLGEVPSRGVWFPGSHEPLITVEVHEAAVARAARDASIPPRSRTPKHSLSGITWCGECGGRAQVRTVTSKVRARQVTMMCSAQVFTTPKTCDGFGAPSLATLEAKVLAQVRHKMQQLRDDPGARAAAVAERNRRRDNRDELERELADDTTALARLAGEWARKRIPDAVYEAAVAEFEAKEARLRAALAEATVPPPIDMTELALLGERLLTMWPGMDPEERGRALRSVVRRITVYRGVARGQHRIDVNFVY